MLSYLVAIAIIGGIYSLLTLGLNLHYGFTGLINFGHVGFFALGAYASALLTLAGLPFVAGFAAAMAIAALVALPLGVLAIRLRDDYLAIVTLGFSEIIRIVITSEEWLTGGVQGLPGIPRPFSGLGVGGAEYAYLGLVIALNGLAFLLVHRLAASPFGRLIKAVRDNEVALVSLGKDPVGVKIRVFMIGAGLAGLAGALYAHYLTYLSPEQVIPLVTFYVWMAMIIGGTGRNAGVVLGAGILVLILEGSRFVRDLFPGVLDTEMASIRLAIIGLCLVLFVLFRPQGLIGDGVER
ncbi:branched-chain amino acid ABC transporter permease [Vineibacter terrae]|uniref:branched-chain amino acid ABC transporter permease n=1 Tax=Vineibacter terrae TaxID=2586908 RepID=UPI002E2FFA4A|nr:branched-chain amino acid ABC transporter permease [Vineibacter terrae]HEX2887288.1 branched-chain amino acid ABC transporter permease [Vineibacter terrae]